MRALTWQGKQDVRVETVPDPQIVNPRDAIIRITSTAICGSDLHLYDHYIPGMKRWRHPRPRVHGRSGRGRRRRTRSSRSGQRVVVPFVIACGNCFFCQKQQFAACDNSNPADKPDAVGDGLRLSDGRGLRLFAPDRRLCRRTGRICPRALSPTSGRS